MLPGFAKYKLQLARLQAEVGHSQRTADYCTELRRQCALSTSWGDGEQQVARFMGQLEALEEQLSGGPTVPTSIRPDQYRWNLQYLQKHQEYSHYQHSHDETQQNQSQLLSTHSFGDLGQQQVTDWRQQEVPMNAHSLTNSQPVPVVCKSQPSEHCTEISSEQTPAPSDGGAAQVQESGWGLSRLSSLVSTASLVSKLSKAVQGEGTAINADDMSMYFDDKLGRWIDPSTPETDEMAATAAQLAAGPSSIASIAIASSGSVSCKPVDSMTVPPALRTRKRPAKRSMQTLSLRVPAHSRDTACTRGDEKVITSGAAAITVFTPTTPLEPRSQAPENQGEASTGWVEYVPEGVEEHESGNTSHVDEQTNTEQVNVRPVAAKPDASAMHEIALEGTFADDSSDATGSEDMKKGDVTCRSDDAQQSQAKLCPGTTLESKSKMDAVSTAVACEVNSCASSQALTEINIGNEKVSATADKGQVESEAMVGTLFRLSSVSTVGSRVQQIDEATPCSAPNLRNGQLDDIKLQSGVEISEAGADVKAADSIFAGVKITCNASDDEFDPCVREPAEVFLSQLRLSTNTLSCRYDFY
jgi:hypothetical protein